jgi:hypothetical protein
MAILPVTPVQCRLRQSPQCSPAHSAMTLSLNPFMLLSEAGARLPLMCRCRTTQTRVLEPIVRKITKCSADISNIQVPSILNFPRVMAHCKSLTSSLGRNVSEPIVQPRDRTFESMPGYNALCEALMPSGPENTLQNELTSPAQCPAGRWIN